MAFLTTTELECLTATGKNEADGRPKIDKKSGWFEATVQVSALKLTLHTASKCPKRSDSGPPPQALIECCRFYACCLDHEAQHLDKAKKECEKIAKELNKLTGKGLADTEADALGMAKEDRMREKDKDFVVDRYRLSEMHRTFRHSSLRGE
ncbi:hypothetical protein [Leisingera sp. ANG59]|uniref:DUF922 domain-containing protein n=1 Tax=Leisingera sp. ANG59 TaxID=2675221 RepID=UPI00157313CB|nr:hypothetical protein [Leisingera sp. ANG59]NSY38008.1 hypothetical protein [Leisingera sp. ANG59]